METLSLSAARRIALAAQGFADPAPGGMVDRRHLRRVLARIGLLQIDSVSVVARAHYLPLFSRLGPYPRRLLEDAAWGKPRSLFEYWAHEASLLPLEIQPLLRWRMARAERHEGIYGGLATFARERPDAVEAVFATIRDRGALTSSQFDGPKGVGGWWGWSDHKRALEYLFWAGRITSATRRGFERVYDLPDRVFPRSVLDAPTPAPADAHRELLRISARALGVFTAGDLRDYFRLDPEDIKRRLPELVETGEFIPVQVAGWTQQAWMWGTARVPRRVSATALLAPFDPLVWERSRTERLFGFRYRLEIYTPSEKREHGYYVLPFLLGDRLVARVDLKSDRKSGALRVLAASSEPSAPADTATALAGQLRAMAGWLALERAEVSAPGAFADQVRASLGGHAFLPEGG